MNLTRFPVLLVPGAWLKGGQMFNSIRKQKMITLNCFIAILFTGLFLSASAMAGDIYGTYQLGEKEFVGASGQKHTIIDSVWIKHKDITNPSYKMKSNKNNRSYASIEHDKELQDKGVMLAAADSQKQDAKKVLGVYRLDQGDFAKGSGKRYEKNVFVWLKKPETSKPEMKLVKVGNKITLVRIDRKQKDQQQDQYIQLADKSMSE
jgi:hypothetical protein